MANSVSGRFDRNVERRISEFLRELSTLDFDRADELVLSLLEDLVRRYSTFMPSMTGMTWEVFEKSGDPRPFRHTKTQDIVGKIDRIEAVLKSATPNKPSYSPKDIAEMEGVKPGRVREWIRDGKLRSVCDPYRKAGPRPRHVILSEDYERFKRGGH